MSCATNKALAFLAARMSSERHALPAVALMRRITMIGIAIAVAVLVVSLSIARGFQSAYKHALLDFNAHAVVLLDTGTSEQTEFLHELQNSAFGVRTVTPFLYREGLFIAGGAIQGAVVKGVDLESLSAVKRMRVDRWDTAAANRPTVILGTALAERLGVSAAGRRDVTLMIPVRAGRTGLKEERMNLHVAGLFHSGLYDYDSQYALMEIGAARHLFAAAPHEVTGFEITLDDPDRADAFVAALHEKLPAGDQALSWSELNEDLLAAVRLEQLVITIIMGTLVLVAALNIIGLMVLMVRSRLHEYAILTALGMTPRAAISLMLLGGMRAGLIGIVGGVGVGLAVLFFLAHVPLLKLDPEIYFLDRLPLDISGFLCGIIATFCLAGVGCAALLAARKLANIPVGEGLHQS